MSTLDHASTWTRFWHAPLRAERLAITRLFFALALFTNQLFEYIPNLMDFYGPEGAGYSGLVDEFQLSIWRWTILLFGTDDPTTVWTLFGLWMAATAVWLVGWQTRFANVVVWFLTMLFINRNPHIKNGGDDILTVGLFLLMLSPSGRAFSIDAWLRRRKLARLGQTEALREPVMTPAWPVRLIQIQLCMIYLSTGLAKLIPNPLFGKDWGTWWDGTSLYYVCHRCEMARRAYAEYQVPFWLTAIGTYVAVWFESLFPLLVLNRWTRKWTLWFGVLFHIAIYLTIEVGWFSYYTICMYGVWIPREFWDRWLKRSPRLPTSRNGNPDGLHSRPARLQ
jgi:hypothetical protein